MKNLAILLIAPLIGASTLWGQGTITDGSATFERVAFLPNFNTANYTVGGGLDHVFEDSWYFRISGDSDESLLFTPVTQQYAGASSTLGWPDVNSRGLLSAQLVSTVEELDGGAASVIRHDLTVTNISASAFEIDIFGYLDYDLTDTQFDDQAFLARDPDLITVLDDSTMCEVEGVGAIAFQATDTQGLALSLRNLMQDGLVTDLDGSGLPFGPADWEGAFQWTATIEPGASETFTKIYTINRLFSSIFADGFESGDTLAW